MMPYFPHAIVEDVVLIFYASDKRPVVRQRSHPVCNIPFALPALACVLVVSALAMTTTGTIHLTVVPASAPMLLLHLPPRGVRGARVGVASRRGRLRRARPGPSAIPPAMVFVFASPGPVFAIPSVITVSLPASRSITVACISSGSVSPIGRVRRLPIIPHTPLVVPVIPSATSHAITVVVIASWSSQSTVLRSAARTSRW